MGMGEKRASFPFFVPLEPEGVNPVGMGVWDCPYSVVAGSVDDVHGGHVLVQEVAPDGDGVAAAAVVLLDGDARSVARARRAQAATPAGGKHSSEGKRLHLEWHSFPLGIPFLQNSKPHPTGSERQVKGKITNKPQNLGSGAVSFSSSRESCNAASCQGIPGWQDGSSKDTILGSTVFKCFNMEKPTLTELQVYL